MYVGVGKMLEYPSEFCDSDISYVRPVRPTLGVFVLQNGWARARAVAFAYWVARSRPLPTYYNMPGSKGPNNDTTSGLSRFEIYSRVDTVLDLSLVVRL